jgi:hypothetical protein
MGLFQRDLARIKRRRFMKASGNGLPQRFAYNLLRIVSGEVAYERAKGIDGSLVDNPSATAAPEAINDARRQLEMFEPRISVDDVDIEGALAETGNMLLNVSMHKKEDEES